MMPRFLLDLIVTLKHLFSLFYSIISNGWYYLNFYFYMYVYVCVCERERGGCVPVCVHMYTSCCTHMKVRRQLSEIGSLL